MMKQHAYGKIEKLKKKSDLDALFKHGKWKSVEHLRIIFLQNEHIDAMKIGVSVPKRNFKKAVDRNRIKRLLRESYRLNKPLFHDKWNGKAHAMLFWSSKKMPQNYQEVRDEVIHLLSKI